MKVGIFTKNQQIGWPELRDFWLRAERLGFDSAWLNDHLVPRTDLYDSVFEGWTLLASLATATERIRIGHLVTANTFRHPALLAKMAATVDHTSGGRLTVGIGTGSFEVEHDVYGIPLRSKPERDRMLAETCQILKGLWSERQFSLAGEFYTITDAPAEPKPMQAGGIPILIGTAGKRNLRTTARFADLWHCTDRVQGITPDYFRAKHEILKEECTAIGRDSAEIEACIQWAVVVDENEAAAHRRYQALATASHWEPGAELGHGVAGTPAQVTEALRTWEAAGVDHLMVNFVAGINYTDLELFAGAVLPDLRS